MARVEVADHAGACFGVERALKLVRELRAQGDGALSTLGPLIHNPRVVAELEAAGVGVASTLAKAQGGTLVLRSHGTAPELVEQAHASGFDVVDATCPYVAKVQRTARRLGDEGYGVVVVGEAGHAEVESIRAWGGASIVAVVDAPEALPDQLPGRVGVVVQTTQSKQLVDAVVAELRTRVSELRVEDTVCFATQERRAAAQELASRADCMLVLGGRNSGNTRRLYELCAQVCPNTHHIEDAAEVEPAWLAQAELVGITAGASTPAEQIEAVKEQLRGM